MENFASVEVEIFVQDLAGNKAGMFLTLPMDRKELKELLIKNYGFNELYVEIINAKGFGLDNTALCKVFSNYFNIWDINTLVSFLNNRAIKNATSLLFYAEGRGFNTRERIINMDYFNETVKKLGWSASEILTQVQDFNFSDNYFILDENNLIYSVSDYELEEYAREEMKEIFKKILLDEIAA